MNDKLIYIPNDNKQNHPFYRILIEHRLIKPASQDLPEVWRLSNEGTRW